MGVEMGPLILGNTKGVFVYSHGAEYDYTLIYSYYVYQVPRQLKLSQSPRGTLQLSYNLRMLVCVSVRVSPKVLRNGSKDFLHIAYTVRGA